MSTNQKVAGYNPTQLTETQEEIHNYEIPTQIKSTGQQKDNRLFIKVLMGIVLVFVVSAIGVLYYIPKNRLQNNIMATAQILADDYHKWRPRNVIDFGENCEYGQKLRELGFTVICDALDEGDPKKLSDWGQYLEISLSGPSDPKIEETVKRIAARSEKGIVIGWKNLDYITNKKTFNKVNQTLKKYQFFQASQQSDQFSEKLPKIFTNNIYVFKKSGILYSRENGAFEGKDLSLYYNHFFTKRILNVLLDLYPLKEVQSVVDFGGGLCTYAEKLKQLGYDVECYDGNSETPNITAFGKYMDLTVPQYLGRQFDWVQSFEVGEHIPADKSEIYVDLLTKHAKKGIIISWAIPSQGGFGHINQKSNEEVIKLLYSRGFHLNQTLTIQYRKHSLQWFQTNILIFQRNPNSTQNTTPTTNYSALAQRVQIAKISNNINITVKQSFIMSQTKQISILLETDKAIQYKNLTEMKDALAIDFPRPFPPENIQCIQDPQSLKEYRCILEYGKKNPPRQLPILVTLFYQEYYCLENIDLKPDKKDN